MNTPVVGTLAAGGGDASSRLLSDYEGFGTSRNGPNSQNYQRKLFPLSSPLATREILNTVPEDRLVLNDRVVPVSQSFPYFLEHLIDGEEA